MKATVIIPARWESSRFPGKPLAMINGATLIEHTWRAAMRTGLPVIVATDSVSIAEEVKRFGGRHVITGRANNGTERCAAAALALGLTGTIVNWQGDSPLVPAHWIAMLIDQLAETGAAVATPVQLCTQEQIARIKGASLAGEPTATMATLTDDFRALYFSKAVIPYRGPFWLHVGVYAYQMADLAAYGRQLGRLETSEQLEQLRFLERGQMITCVPVDGPPIWEVNHPVDVATVGRLLEDHHETVRA